MSRAKRLPDEVLDFLKAEGPQTLLVRGGPGTGKTSLCFEMLHEFEGRKLYVTCRVAPAKIRQDFHWLAGPDPVDWKILDLTTRPSSIEEAAKVLINANHLLSATEGNDEALRALWLPGAIQEAWGQTDPNEPTCIVIDPWNAFVEQYADSGGQATTAVPSVREIERTLLNLIGRTRIHLIFVIEGPDQSLLDYLVDGVIVAERPQVGAYLERWLTLSKLRGVAINQPLYPFTLDGGRFQCVSPSLGPGGMVPAKPETDPLPSPGELWPGNADFARTFGRLRSGAMTLFELAPEVPREVPRVLLLPIMAQVLGDGGRVVLIPPPTLSHEDSYSGLRKLVSPEVLNERFRILGVFPTQEMTANLASVFVPPARISWTKDGVTVPVPDDPVFRVGSPDKKIMNLMVVYFSGIEGLAQSAAAVLTREAIPGAAHITFGGAPVHLVAVGRAGDAYFGEMSPLAGSHIRIEGRQGRILLHGFRPFTEEFAMTQATEQSPYRLMRMN